MYINVNFELFRDEFTKMNRANNFSYQGLRTLFDYFEELESSTGDSIELDVIAICCAFSEYTIDEALEQYGFESEEELRENHAVLEVDDLTVIICE